MPIIPTVAATASGRCLSFLLLLIQCQGDACHFRCCCYSVWAMHIIPTVTNTVTTEYAHGLSLHISTPVRPTVSTDTIHTPGCGTTQFTSAIATATDSDSSVSMDYITTAVRGPGTPVFVDQSLDSNSTHTMDQYLTIPIIHCVQTLLFQLQLHLLAQIDCLITYHPESDQQYRQMLLIHRDVIPISLLQPFNPDPSDHCVQTLLLRLQLHLLVHMDCLITYHHRSDLQYRQMLLIHRDVIPISLLQLSSRGLTFAPAHHTVSTTLFRQYRLDLRQLLQDLNRYLCTMRVHCQVRLTCARHLILVIPYLTPTQMKTNRSKGLHLHNVFTLVTVLLAVRESGTLLHPDVVASPSKMLTFHRCNYTVLPVHIPRTPTSFAQRQKC
jgi:hypothetical protein